MLDKTGIGQGLQIALLAEPLAPQALPSLFAAAYLLWGLAYICPTSA